MFFNSQATYLTTKKILFAPENETKKSESNGGDFVIETFTRNNR